MNFSTPQRPKGASARDGRGPAPDGAGVPSIAFGDLEYGTPEQPDPLIFQGGGGALITKEISWLCIMACYEAQTQL